jgi:hypothetical protein
MGVVFLFVRVICEVWLGQLSVYPLRTFLYSCDLCVFLI